MLEPYPVTGTLVLIAVLVRGRSVVPWVNFPEASPAKICRSNVYKPTKVQAHGSNFRVAHTDVVRYRGGAVLLNDHGRVGFQVEFRGVVLDDGREPASGRLGRSFETPIGGEPGRDSQRRRSGPRRCAAALSTWWQKKHVPPNEVAESRPTVEGMLMDPRQGIDWARIDRGDFERFVDAVLVRDYRSNPTQTAAAVDGRGGDGGIDIDVTEEGKTVHVYQLKYFPEGFSGGWGKSRKQQIQRSFDEAMKIPDLQDWTLVVPGNATPTERRWVFARRPKESSLRIHVMGRAELDEMFARHGDLLRWATHDPLVNTLRQASQEKLLMPGPDDLAERVRGLAEIADARSIYWGVDLKVERGTVTHAFYAKRPDAAEREPISIEFVTRFSPEHAELERQYQRALDYGTTRTIQLPPNVIKSLRIMGPEWIAREADAGAIEMHPGSLAQPLSAELRLLDESGITMSSLRGRIPAVNHGRLGMTITFRFRGGFSMSLIVPKEGMASETQMSYQLEGQTASDALAVLRFVKGLEEGNAFQLIVDGKETFKMVSPQRAEGDPAIEPEFLALIEDLAYLEREFALTFSVPSETSGRDHIDVRAARLLAEGRCIIWPSISGFHATLNGRIDDGLREMLAGPRAYSVSAPGFESDIFGQRLRLGTLRAYHPSAVVKDAAEVLRDLEAGTAENRKIEMVSSDGSGYRIWIDERWANPDAPLVPVPLDIPGLAESATYWAAIESADSSAERKAKRSDEVHLQADGSEQEGPSAEVKAANLPAPT